MIKKILYLTYFFVLLFFSCYIINCQSIVVASEKNIFNVSASSRYFAVESEKNINGNVFHYIFLYDILKKEKVEIYSNNGDIINSDMYFPSITNDGKYLTYTSRADNITDDIIGKCLDIQDNIVKNCSNIYLYDIENKQSILLKYNNQNFNGDNYVSKISGNGTDIVFESISDNYVSNNFDCSRMNGVKNCINIYKYNLSTKQISLISTNSYKLGGNSNSINPSISSDGRFITFQSSASNILTDVKDFRYCSNYVTNESDICSNVFFVDTRNMIIKILSHDGNSFFNDSSGNAIISGDGNFVAFESYASNISKKKNRHIYLYDIKKEKIEIISKLNEILNNKESFLDDISNVGKYLLYRTDSSNIETNIGVDLYVYNTNSKKTFLINNTDVVFSVFYQDKVCFYNNFDFSCDKIDDISPFLNNQDTIHILKKNFTNIIDKINVEDNLSSKENININLKNIEIIKSEGEHELEVEMIDEFNNVGIGYVKVIVLSEDIVAPVFSSISEIRVEKGTKSLNLNTYLEAVDDVDGKTRIYIIDDNNLNLNVSGKYKINIMTSDYSNNVAYKEIYIIVYENYNFEYYYEIIAVLCLIVVIIFSIIKVK